MKIELTLALTMLAVIGCDEPADQPDTCVEWDGELGEELDCGSMGETTTEAEAETVLACMNDALDSGQPATASYRINYDDGEFDDVSELYVWHVRASGEDPRIISSWSVRKTPEAGPAETSSSGSACEQLSAIEHYIDAPDLEVGGWRLFCSGQERLCS